LPGATGITKVNVNVGFQRGALMICEFFASIPGQ